METIRTTPALVDERNESDDDLLRERKLVDATVNEIQHDIHVAPALRRSIRELRSRLRQKRHDVDHARAGARKATDTALEGEQHHVQELRAIMCEIEIIAAAVHAIRMRYDPADEGDGDLSAIEFAAVRVLGVVGKLLDET